jgi:hypothetical protein
LHSAQEFGRLPKRKNAPRDKFDFEPVNLKKPSGRPKWKKSAEKNLSLGPKMGKSPKVKLEFGSKTMGKSSEPEFDFEHLNPKKPHRAPL